MNLSIKLIIATASVAFISGETGLGVCSSGDFVMKQATPAFIHSEGPHWDVSKQKLIFVDISNETVNSFDPIDQTVHTVYIGGPVTPVIPTRKDGWYIVGTGRDLVTFEWDGKSANRGALRVLANVDRDKPKNRFNDGKADASGRLWVGTMGPEINMHVTEEQGSLYSFSYLNNFQPKRQLTDVSISNGLGWSNNDTIMFYVDSPLRRVDAFDFDLLRGELKNRRTIFKLDNYNISGLPDGMCVDSDDNVWVAVFRGGCILHIDTRTGQLLRNIKLPTRGITSCAFGGPKLDVLYVTTSRKELSPDEVKTQPSAGSVLALTGLGRGQRKSNTVRTGVAEFLKQYKF